MPFLDAEQFAYVVTHAELLALLSLQRLEAQLDANANANGTAPSADELAATEAAAMAELARQQQQWLEPTDGKGTPTFAVPADHFTAAAIDLGTEIDAALARAYAAIPARAQALRGVDTSGLEPALAALPEALSTLTRPLPPTGVSAWLDLYDSGDPALERLLVDATKLAGLAG